MRVAAFFLSVAVIAPIVVAPAGRQPALAAGDPRCEAPAVAAGRGGFKTAYDTGKFADAAAILQDILSACDAAALPAATRGAIANDLALALHRAGDDRGCLEALLDYEPDAAPTGPRAAALSPELRRAMRFNWNKCAAVCAGAPAAFDATCASVAAAAQAANLVVGFKAAPCPLVTDHTAVALPDGTCLTVLPAGKRFDPATAETEPPAEICPTLALIARRDGQVRTTKLETPPRSFLRSLEFCCGGVKLGVDSSGRVAATPDENPPEGCLFGHRTAVMQDIFKLEGGRPKLVRQLSTPWFP